MCNNARHFYLSFFRRVVNSTLNGTFSGVRYKNGISQRANVWKLTYWSHFNNLLATDCYTWGKVFKNGPSKICGRQPLKKLKWYDLLRQNHCRTRIVARCTCKTRLVTHSTRLTTRSTRTTRFSTCSTPFSTRSTRFCTRNTRLSIRLFIHSTRLSTRSTRLSTRSMSVHAQYPWYYLSVFL